MRCCPRCRSTYAEETDFCGIDGERLVEMEQDPLIGTRIDRYEFVERLGGGAMGVVYLAQHTELGRRYAIKILYGDIAANRGLVSRFRREARALGQIEHPNITSVIDFGTSEAGLSFLVMEYVVGETLQDLLYRTGPLEPAHAVRLVHQIALALDAAHQQGFVHRDVKTTNIMLFGPPGGERVKLLDFGIVGLADSNTATKLTGTGRILGTPRYMSPEQARGFGVGPRADLYSLGIILYEMLAGDVPFPSDNIADVLVMHSTMPPPPLDAPEGIEALVMELLEKRPEDRPATARAVLDRLEQSYPELSTPQALWDHDHQRTDRPARGEEALEVPPLAVDPPLGIADDLVVASAKPAPSPEASVFNTLGGAQIHQPPSPNPNLSMWARRTPMILLLSLIFSISAVAIAMLILRERPDAIHERMVSAESRARKAELRAKAALAQAQEAERAAKRIVDTATTAAAAIQVEKEQRAKRGQSGVTIAERELVFRHTLHGRGLTMADLRHLDATKELADIWMDVRGQENEEVAKILTALIEKTAQTTLTNQVLWKKYERVARDLSLLEKADPKLVTDLLDQKRSLRRQINRRGLSQQRREQLSTKLTELELELTSRLMKTQSP